MPIFRRIVAKQCEKPGCTSYRQPVLHGGFCEQCGDPLTPVFGWDLRVMVLAVGGPVVLTLLGYGLFSYLANRPRPLNEERRARVEAWVRNADRDQVVTQQEKAALDGLVKQERLDAGAVAGFVAELRRRLDESRQGIERGHQLARQGRYEEARQELRRAVESDPENAMAWANLGMANAASGSEQEAVESYSKALSLDPKSWLAHYNLGLLQARRGNPEEALRHLEQAFAVQPDPASPEHRSMIADLQSSAPAALRKEPRFAALVGSSGGR